MNLKLLETLKESFDASMRSLENNRVSLPLNLYYLITEARRAYQDMRGNNGRELIRIVGLNIRFLETIKELANILIIYSEKNNIHLPPELYGLVHDGNNYIKV